MKPKTFLIPILCLSLLAPSLPPAAAHAAPLAKPGINIGIGAGAALVQWRRGGPGGRYYGGRRHRGPGPAGIFGAIIAGALIAAAISEGRARREDVARCQEEFYSFDPRTGTYINRYGEERICPYLR